MRPRSGPRIVASTGWRPNPKRPAPFTSGHVRVYHGKLTKLPRRYVTRQRLCLRGTTDYWVNDAIGRPFFLIEKPFDPGLIQVIEHDIVPRRLKEVPNPPDKKEFEANPHLGRFVLVFDREGYSPDFFARMWRTHRIACFTYHKHPAKAWPESWFEEKTAIMPAGETVTMRLAEMGSLLGSGKNAFWVREVRKLTDSGHQTGRIGGKGGAAELLGLKPTTLESRLKKLGITRKP